MIERQPLWVRHWPLIMLMVWVAMFCAALLLRTLLPPVTTYETLEQRKNQPIVSEPPPLPKGPAQHPSA